MSGKDAPPEIVIEPYQKIVVHEVIEYRFNDYIELVLTGIRAAGGATIPVLQWCNGIIFQINPFNPNSETVIEQQLEGTIHLNSVNFAVREKYEQEVRTALGTVRLVDASANPSFVVLADVLKQRSKFKTK